MRRCDFGMMAMMRMDMMPMCMMHTMRCYTLFQPFVRIMAVLVACSCLIQVIQAACERRH